MSFILVIALSALTGAYGERDAKNSNLLDSRLTHIEGLPVNGIRKTVQTPDGLLWIATNSGLLRYDGTNIDHFHTKNTPSLRFDMIQRLTACVNGDLWLASEQPSKLGEPLNLVRYRNGAFQAVNEFFPHIRSHHPDLTIRDILCDSEGGIYLATAKDLSHIDKKGRVKRVNAGGGQIDDLVISEDGTLLAIGRKIETWSPKQSKLDWVNHATINDDSYDRKRLVACTIENENTLWLASANELFKVTPGETRRWRAEEDLGTYNLRSLHFDRKGSLWIGSYEGIFCFENGELLEPHGKPSTQLQLTFDIFEDRSGKIWLSQSNGLARVTPIKFKLVEEPDPRFESPPDSFAKNSHFIDALAPDGATIRLVGKELFKIVDGEIEHLHSIPDEHAETDWELIAVSLDGDIWLGGSGSSVLRLGTGIAKAYFAWAGEILNGYIYDLVADPVAGMWAATPDGLSYLSDEDSVHIVVKDGLITSDAIAITFDPDGNLWIASRNILQCIDSDHLEDYLNGESSELMVRAWAEENGYPASFGVPDFRPILSTDFDGRLSLSTLEGVYQATLNDLLAPTSKSSSVITHIFVNGKIAPQSDPVLQLPGGKATAEIHFTVPDFQSPQTARSRYRLLGVDDDWQEAPSPARYPQLLPGDYQFEIQSRHSYNDWDSITQISMVVPKLWYQRSSTWVLFAFGTFGTLGIFIFLRIRNHQKAKLLLELRVQESTQDLSEANWKLQKLSDSLRAHSIELEELASEKSELAERALAADRTKGEFITNIGHEVRTPLNGILGMAQLIDDSRLSPDQRELLESMKNCGEHLLQLFDGILHFSQLEGGYCKVDYRPTDLEMLVESIASQATNVEVWKHVPIICDIEPDLPSGAILAEDSVRNVLYNLLSNAIKFSGAGAVTLRLEMMRAKDGDPALAFTVEDCGGGIPEEMKKRLFQPFVHSDSDEYEAGLGLGLAISHRLATAMSGNLDLVASNSKGSCFRLTVPYQLCDEIESSQFKVLPCDQNSSAWVFSTDVRVAEAISRVLRKWNLNARVCDPNTEIIGVSTDTLPDLFILSAVGLDDFNEWDTYFTRQAPQGGGSVLVISHHPFSLPTSQLGPLRITHELCHPCSATVLRDSIADALLSHSSPQNSRRKSV